MKSKIPIVDEDDNIIGYKDRESVKYEDIYRVSALWIMNSKGEILLAKRALTKSHSPGKWGPAVAGTVEEVENYLANIVKEAEEEIGLKNIKPLISHKIRVSGENNYFCQWYLLKMDRPASEFAIDRSEVEQVHWFSTENLLEEIKNYPDKFLKNMEKLVGLFSK